MTQSIDQLHLLILNVGLAIHNADWNWKNVSSPFTRLYYIMEGTAQIIFPDGIQELKPHHLYLVPSFTTHSYQCNSHFTHYYLHIYEDHQSESGILEDWNFPIEIPAGNLELPLIKRLCEINPTMQRQPLANRFLAGLTPFLFAHKHRPEIRNLLISCFTDFFTRNVMQYEYHDILVHFTGSIAFYFQEEVKEAALRLNVSIGKVLKSPLEGLKDYHFEV